MMTTELTKWIRVSSRVYDHLVEQGRKNETFDQIIRRLLNVGGEAANAAG